MQQWHRQCGFCGYLLYGKETKCPQCQKNVCLNCGNILGISVEACPRCGQKTTLGAFNELAKAGGNLGVTMMVIGAIILLVVASFLFC